MMEDKKDPPSWKIWASQKLGAIGEMARTNRERIVKIEDETGIAPPDTADDQLLERIDDLEQEIQEAPDRGGILGYLEHATSSRQRLVATVVLLSVIALLLIVLASNDITLPFIGGEWAAPILPTLRRSQLRSFALLYEQKPQDAPTGDDHEEEQKRVHSRE